MAERISFTLGQLRSRGCPTATQAFSEPRIKESNTPMHHRARGIVGDDLYDKVLIPRVHARRAGRSDEIAQTPVRCSLKGSA